MILNTIVAQALSEFADELEKSRDFRRDLNELIHRTLLAHRRILFNGNNYSEEWRQEAEKRGLSNFCSTVDALPHYTDEKNVRMFDRLGVLTPTEIASRQEVLLENYSKTILIEALTMIDLVRKDVAPAVLRYENDLLEERQRKALFPKAVSSRLEDELVDTIASLSEMLYARLTALEADVVRARAVEGTVEAARFYRGTVFADMAELRAVVDELETTVARDYWPFPTYAEMLYSVK